MPPGNDSKLPALSLGFIYSAHPLGVFTNFPKAAKTPPFGSKVCFFKSPNPRFGLPQKPDFDLKMCHFIHLSQFMNTP